MTDGVSAPDEEAFHLSHRLSFVHRNLKGRLRYATIGSETHLFRLELHVTEQPLELIERIELDHQTARALVAAGM
jgi:hypothetical protein